MVAVLNARRFRGHVRRQEELAVLYEAARVSRASSSPGPMVAALRPLLGRLFDARRLLALVWNAPPRTFDLLWGSGAGWVPDDAGLELRVIERAQPLRTLDYLATCANEGRAPSPYAHGLRYALTVPMRAASRVVGTLSFWSGERPYSRADEELATTVAGLPALRLIRPSGR